MQIWIKTYRKNVGHICSSYLTGGVYGDGCCFGNGIGGGSCVYFSYNPMGYFEPDDVGSIFSVKSMIEEYKVER